MSGARTVLFGCIKPNVDLTGKWPGRTLIYGKHGGCISDISHTSQYISIALQFLGIVLYFVFPARYLTSNVNDWAFIVAGIALSITFTSFYFLASFTDPGVLPRCDPLYNPPASSSSHSSARPPGTQNIVVNGKMTQLKFCDFCNLFRPPRCSHCNICNNCVARFDHHCPWIGNCVGTRNYRYFFGFLVSVLSFILYTIAMCWYELVLRKDEYEDEGSSYAWGKAIVDGLGSFILFFYAASMFFFVFTLCAFHTYLICSNKTTCDYIKSAFREIGNPHGTNTIINFRFITMVLCQPRHPSYIKQWAHVETADLDDEDLCMNLSLNVYALNNKEKCEETSLSQFSTSVKSKSKKSVAVVAMEEADDKVDVKQIEIQVQEEVKSKAIEMMVREEDQGDGNDDAVPDNDSSLRTVQSSGVVTLSGYDTAESETEGDGEENGDENAMVMT